MMKAMFKHQMEESLTGTLHLPESTRSILVLCNLLYRGHDSVSVHFDPLFRYKLQAELIRMFYRLELHNVGNVKLLFKSIFGNLSCDGEAINELYKTEPSLYSPGIFIDRKTSIEIFSNVDKICDEFWQGCIENSYINIWSFAANVLKFHIYSSTLLYDSLKIVKSFKVKENDKVNYKTVMSSNKRSLLNFLQYIVQMNINRFA